MVADHADAHYCDNSEDERAISTLPRHDEHNHEHTHIIIISISDNDTWKTNADGRAGGAGAAAGAGAGAGAGGGGGGAWCLVPGAWCLVPGAWCLVPGAWCLVPGAWCLVPGAGGAGGDNDMARQLGDVKKGTMPSGTVQVTWETKSWSHTHTLRASSFGKKLHGHTLTKWRFSMTLFKMFKGAQSKRFKPSCASYDL